MNVKKKNHHWKKVTLAVLASLTLTACFNGSDDKGDNGSASNNMVEDNPEVVTVQFNQLVLQLVQLENADVAEPYNINNVEIEFNDEDDEAFVSVL